MVQPARSPSGNNAGVRWRDFGRRSCPSFDQLLLQGSRLVIEHPVAALTNHLVSEMLENLRRPSGPIRSERPTETLVGLLMTIHEISNELISRIFRRALHTAVVRERKEHRRPLALTCRAHVVQPSRGNQIEQRRCGYEIVAGGKGGEVGRP